MRSNDRLIKSMISSNLNSNTREVLEKSLAYKTEDRMSISGMKYLTDVFNIHNRGQKTCNSMSQMTNSNHQNSYLAPLNLPQNLPHRETFTKGDRNYMKDKVASTIMYTKLPGKKMKENKELPFPGPS